MGAKKTAAKQTAKKAQELTMAEKFDLAAKIDEGINEILGNKLRARAKIKHFTIQQCENLIELANDRLEEAKAEENERIKQEQMREFAVAKATELLNQAGLTLQGDAIIDQHSGKAMTARTVKATQTRKSNINGQKYSVTDVNGYVRYWSGIGQTPTQFKQAFENGLRKEECLGGHHRKIKWAFESTKGCEDPQPYKQREAAQA